MPKFASTQRKLATALSRQFGRVSQSEISLWQASPPFGADPFPSPTKDGFDVAACAGWFEQSVLPARNQREAGRAADLRLKEVRTKRLEHLARVEDGSFISRVKAENTALGVVKKLMTFYNQTDERETPKLADRKLEELGLSAEARVAFRTWFVARQENVVDQRCAAAAKAAENVSETLNAL